MEQITPEECTSKLFEAVHLFINYSVQDYISRGIIQANEKPRFMRELWGRLEQSALEKNRTFNNKATASTCFTFE
ncbi:hypothetical protein MY948_01320 [Haemophilus influenzae]|nr:hypothetical protein [Haemophilus influenzae]